MKRYHTPPTPESEDVFVKWLPTFFPAPPPRIPIPKIERATEKTDCLHMQCSNCNGTGVSKYGGLCVHALSCPCSRCSPWSMSRDIIS